MSKKTQKRRKPSRPLGGFLSLDAADIFLFVTGLLTFVEIELGGKLFASELLLALYLILALANGANPLKDRYPRVFLTLASLWLLSQIATDIFRESAPEDSLRGLAKIVFLMTSFVSLYLLAKPRPSRLVAFLYGLSLGQLLRFFTNGDQRASVDPWKWGLAFPIAFFLIASASVAFKKKWRFAAVVLALVGLAANVYYNFRSSSIMFVIVVSALVFRTFAERTVLRRETLVAAVAILAISLGIFTSLYTYAVTSGWLGYVALRKHEAQSQGDLGIVVGGRFQSFISIQAILDSPILGHGSNAKEPRYMNALLQDYLNHGYGSDDVYEYTGDSIPSHSYILGSWVEAGMIGGLFWIIVLALVCKAAIGMIRTPQDLLQLKMFAFAWMAWNIPFSPYSFTERLFAPFFLATVFLTLVQTAKINPQRHQMSLPDSNPARERVPQRLQTRY